MQLRSLLALFAIAAIALTQCACALALEGGLAEGLALEGLGAEAFAARAAAGAMVAEEAGLAARLGTLESIGGRAAVLGEARIAALASRAGLEGVLEELAESRAAAVIDGSGRIVVNGEAVLATNGSRVSLSSTGTVIGRLRGSRIFATDSLGQAGAEIGEFQLDRGRVGARIPIDVIRVRPGWYRVVGSSESVGGLSPVPLAVVLADQRRKESDDVREKALAALAAIRSFRTP